MQESTAAACGSTGKCPQTSVYRQTWGHVDMLIKLAQKSGKITGREAEGSKVKLEPASLSDHGTFREGGCCLILLPQSGSRFSVGHF